MKILSSTITFALLLCAQAPILANEEVTIDFIEAGRANIYFNNSAPRSDGYYISGRKSINQHVYVVGDYFNTRVDSFGFATVIDELGRPGTRRLSVNDDFKEFSLGLGYSHYLSEHSFVRLEARYYELEQEKRADFSITYTDPIEVERSTTTDAFDDSGSILEVGYSARPFNRFEFDVGLGYRNIASTRGVYAELSVAYLLGDNWRVGFSTEQGDDDRFMIGAAYRF
jgi:hypothetical protein